MPPTLAAAGAAGHEGGAQVPGGEKTPLEHADDRAARRQEAGRASLLHSAPSPDAPGRAIGVEEGPHTEAGNGAEHDQRGAAGNCRLRLLAEFTAPQQDGPRRIEREVGIEPERGTKGVRPAVGPGERLGCGLQAQNKTRHKTKKSNRHEGKHPRTDEATSENIHIGT